MIYDLTVSLLYIAEYLLFIFWNSLFVLESSIFKYVGRMLNKKTSKVKILNKVKFIRVS